jgi:hypothetical protein
MEVTTKEGVSRTDLIAFFLLLTAVGVALAAYALGHTDPDTKTAVLLCLTNLVTALTSIGATLLVGKSATSHQVSTSSGQAIVEQDTKITAPVAST